ncbi:hypothetical protein B0H17DRAFT_1123553 [Mycena rosella]|uniref:Fe2OG dioxygenase domain-containing protein n=1 Tax=Mycena rosella TaxID=1033263 RepID=A0AAD7MC85_MYCRO|nr:hypothetical protein B0H17DRAFT_1123553 [Mycena rosella]
MQYHGKANNQLRLLHYPSVPAEAIRSEHIGPITAHSDYASLTLLLQDDVGGLEIKDPNGAGLFRSLMKPAPPIPGALIVNVADFMMRCTQDRETVLDCIPGTWDQEKPQKYEPISVRFASAILTWKRC